MNFKNISIVLKLFEIFEVNAYCNNVWKFIVNICIIIICQNLYISYNIKLFKILKLCKIIDFRKKIKKKMRNDNNEKNNKQIIEIHNYDLFNIN